MILSERRRHFLINKALQLRYLASLTLIVAVVTGVSLLSLYFGIWGGVLDAFSNEQIRNDLLTASRIQEYEEARIPRPADDEGFSTLSWMKQSERLSQRQREVFKNILDQTNRGLAKKLALLLFFIAWGTIFLSHKIAGPLFRFQRIFETVAQGDLSTRCHLRKFDEAKAVAGTLNQALESLDLSISRMKKILQQHQKDPLRAVEQLKTELSKFKTIA